MKPQCPFVIVAITIIALLIFYLAFLKNAEACAIHRGVPIDKLGKVAIYPSKYGTGWKYLDPKDDPYPSDYTETGYWDFRIIKEIIFEWREIEVLK